MTRKEELFAEFEKVKDKVSNITLFIHMPTGETEIISNPRVLEKMWYIDKTYNDNLIHTNCEEIQIKNYVFETQEDTMDFGSAILNLKEGHKVARKGWNGKEMFLYLTSGSEVPVVSLKPETANHLFGNRLMECDVTVRIGSHIDLRSADDSIVVGWTASQTDMLAEDWITVK